MRRYLIHRNADVTENLLFGATVGRWHVEKARPQKARLRYTPEEFDKSDTGQLPSDRLLVSRLKRAESLSVLLRSPAPSTTEMKLCGEVSL